MSSRTAADESGSEMYAANVLDRAGAQSNTGDQKVSEERRAE